MGATVTPRQVIALDVGGTSIKSGVVAESGVIINKPLVTPIHSQGAADEIFGTFTEVLHVHLQSMDNAALAGIVIGFPGQFDFARGICWSHNLDKYDALHGLNVGDELRQRLPGLHAPIKFYNDAEIAIVGEARYGAGRGLRRVLGITLGTGMGAAFVADGMPLKGGAGVTADGELYHVPFRGRQADDTFSIRGLLARLRAVDPAVTDIAAASQAALAGEAQLRGVFAQWGADLGGFLNPWVSGFQAEAVLLLGGIARAFPLFGSELQTAVRLEVKLGQLNGVAPLLGAAGLYFETRIPSVQEVRI